MALPEDRAAQSTDELAEIVASALRQGDLSALEPALPNGEDGAEIGRAMAKDQAGPLVEIIARSVPDRARHKIERGWEKIRKKGEARGVAWGELRLLRARAAPQRDKLGRGVDVADLYLQLQAGQLAFGVKVDDCAHTARGWVILDGIRWKGMGSLG